MNRRVQIVVGALVTAGLLVVLGVLLGRSGDHGSSAAAPSSTPARPSPSDPTSQAPMASWVDDYSIYVIPGGQRVPRSTSAGPFHLTERGTLASGFAHSPQGAVMAALNIGVRTNWSLGEPMWRPTIENQVIGPWKNQMLENARRFGRISLPPPGQTVAEGIGIVAGFDLVSYSPEVAQVRWLASGLDARGHESYVAALGQVEWVGAEWRLVAPQDGTWEGSGEAVPDTSGFILLPRY